MPGVINIPLFVRRQMVQSIFCVFYSIDVLGTINTSVVQCLQSDTSGNKGGDYTLSLSVHVLASHRDIHGKPPTQNSLQ